MAADRSVPVIPDARPCKVDVFNVFGQGHMASCRTCGWSSDLHERHSQAVDDGNDHVELDTLERTPATLAIAGTNWLRGPKYFAAVRQIQVPA